MKNDRDHWAVHVALEAKYGKYISCRDALFDEMKTRMFPEDQPAWSRPNCRYHRSLSDTEPVVPACACVSQLTKNMETRPKITFEYADDSIVQFYCESDKWYHRFKDAMTNGEWSQGYSGTRTYIVEFLKNALGRQALRVEALENEITS